MSVLIEQFVLSVQIDVGEWKPLWVLSHYPTNNYIAQVLEENNAEYAKVEKRFQLLK